MSMTEVVFLSTDPIIIPVDAICPNCGWPERTYDVEARKFGCSHSCGYESDERDA